MQPIDVNQFFVPVNYCLFQIVYLK